jgi:hypothetical protein
MVRRLEPVEPVTPEARTPPIETRRRLTGLSQIWLVTHHRWIDWIDWIELMAFRIRQAGV